MRAGELRELVRLEAKNPDALNASGQEVDAWVEEGRAWAQVRPLGVNERQEAERKHGEVTHLVKIRGKHVQPTPAKRWVWYDHKVSRDRILEIVGVADYDERGIEIRSTCKEAQ